VPDTIDEEPEQPRFCRVIMPDGSTAVVGTKQGQTISYVLGKLCERRGLSIASVDVFLLGSEKVSHLKTIKSYFFILCSFTFHGLCCQPDTCIRILVEMKTLQLSYLDEFVCEIFDYSQQHFIQVSVWSNLLCWTT